MSLLEAQIKLEWIVGDITNIKSISQALDNVNVIIHTAAIVDHLDQGDKELLWKVNVQGTLLFLTLHILFILAVRSDKLPKKSWNNI